MCRPKKPTINMPEERKTSVNYLADRFMDSVYRNSLELSRAALGSSMLRVRPGTDEGQRRTVEEPNQRPVVPPPTPNPRQAPRPGDDRRRPRRPGEGIGPIRYQIQ